MIYIILFIMSCLSVGIFRNYALYRGLIDVPNHRSSHDTPIPTGGGVTIMGLWIIFVFILILRGILDKTSGQVLLPGSLLISIISYLDDVQNISAKLRLLCHFLIAAMSMYFLGSIQLNLAFFNLTNLFISGLFSLLFLVWSINLFNFMDGSDGLAGVEACFVLSVGGLFFYIQNAIPYAVISLALVSIIVGFLVWNKPKAKIFMGDVGSTGLGLIIASLALLGQKQFSMPIILWIMMYMCFVYDATITLIRRILNGEKWYQAHRSHAYQRLNQAGWSHGKILQGLISLNLLISGITIVAYYKPQLTIYLISAELSMLTLIYYKIEKIKPMYETTNNLKKLLSFVSSK